MFFRINLLCKKMLLVIIGICVGFNVDAQQRRATRIVPQRARIPARGPARSEQRQRATAPSVRTAASLSPVQAIVQKTVTEPDVFNKQAVLDEAGSVLKIGVRDAGVLDTINLFIKQGADYLDDEDILDYQKNVATKGKRIAAAGLLGAYEKNTAWLAEFNSAEKMYSEFAAMLEKESITVSQEKELLDLYNVLSHLYEEKRTALQKIRIAQEKITWQSLLQKIQLLLNNAETVSFIENIEERKEKREKIAAQEQQRLEQEQARMARDEQERLEQERQQVEKERLQVEEQAQLEQERMRAEAQEAEQRVSRKERIGEAVSKEGLSELAKQEPLVITKEEEPAEKELSAKEQIVVRYLGEVHKNFKSYFDEKRKVLKDTFYKSKNSAELNSLALSAQLAIARSVNDRTDRYFILFGKMHTWLVALSENNAYEANKNKEVFIGALQAMLQDSLVPDQIRGLVSGLLGMFNVQKAVEPRMLLSEEPVSFAPIDIASLEQILTLKNLTLKKGEADYWPSFFEALDDFVGRVNQIIEQTGSIFMLKDTRSLNIQNLKKAASRNEKLAQLFEPIITDIIKMFNTYQTTRDEGPRKIIAKKAMNKLFEIYTQLSDMKSQKYSKNKDVEVLIKEMFLAYQQNILYWLTTIENEAELVQEGDISFMQMQKIAFDFASKNSKSKRGIDSDLVKKVVDCLQSLNDIRFDLSLKDNKVRENFEELSGRVDSDPLHTFIQNTIQEATMHQDFAKITDKKVENKSGIFLAHEFWIQTIIQAETQLRGYSGYALFAEGIARITRGIVGSIEQYLNTVPSLKQYQSYIAEFEMPENVAVLRNGLEIPALSPYVIQGAQRQIVGNFVKNMTELFKDMINGRLADDIQSTYFKDPTSDTYISRYSLKSLNDSIYTFVTDIKSSLSAGINRFNKKMMYAVDVFEEKGSQPWVVYIQFAFARAYAQCMQDLYLKPYDYPELVKQMLETLYAGIDSTVVDTAVKIMERTVLLSKINKKERAQVCETILYAKTRYDLLAEKIDHIVDYIQSYIAVKTPKDLLAAVNKMIGTNYGLSASSEAEPGAQALFVLALIAGAVDSGTTDVSATKQKMITHLKKGLDIAKQLFFMFKDSATAKVDYAVAYGVFDTLAKNNPTSGTKYDGEKDFATYKAGMIVEVNKEIASNPNEILLLYKKYMDLMGEIDFTHVTKGSFVGSPHAYVKSILGVGYTTSSLYFGISQDAETALTILDAELQKTLAKIDAPGYTEDQQAADIKKDIIDTYKDRLKSKFK